MFILIHLKAKNLLTFFKKYDILPKNLKKEGKMKKEVIKEFNVFLDKNFCNNNLRYYKKIRGFHAYRIGGPYFGPCSGPNFWGQHFIFSTELLDSNTPYHLYLISSNTDYLLLKPSSNPPTHLLSLQFTKRWKWKKIGSVWYCSTQHFELPTYSEILLQGGSSSLQARQGSEWALFVLPLSSSSL